MTDQNEPYRNVPPRYDHDALRNVWERPGDPRTEPPINPWASDPEPGRGIVLAVVFVAVLWLFIRSVL